MPDRLLRLCSRDASWKSNAVAYQPSLLDLPINTSIGELFPRRLRSRDRTAGICVGLLYEMEGLVPLTPGRDTDDDDAGTDAEEIADNFSDFVKGRPLLALAAAFVVGFVLARTVF